MSQGLLQLQSCRRLYVSLSWMDSDDGSDDHPSNKLIMEKASRKPHSTPTKDEVFRFNAQSLSKSRRQGRPGSSKSDRKRRRAGSTSSGTVDLAAEDDAYKRARLEPISLNLNSAGRFHLYLFGYLYILPYKLGPQVFIA